MKNMAVRLREIVVHIKDNADNIATASHEIKNMSGQMSQGSLQQTNSADEVSGILEQITQNIKQNTDNAQQTEMISSYNFV